MFCYSGETNTAYETIEELVLPNRKGQRYSQRWNYNINKHQKQ
jgi:hypothetical protein